MKGRAKHIAAVFFGLSLFCALAALELPIKKKKSYYLVLKKQVHVGEGKLCLLDLVDIKGQAKAEEVKRLKNICFAVAEKRRQILYRPAIVKQMRAHGVAARLLGSRALVQRKQRVKGIRAFETIMVSYQSNGLSIELPAKTLERGQIGDIVKARVERNQFRVKLTAHGKAVYVGP